MTSEEIIRVANIVMEWYFIGHDDKYGKLDKKEEQAILDMYYSKYGVYEQDWQEIAESIR